jgi:DNA polymerase-3 subunit gamma/tau
VAEQFSEEDLARFLQIMLRTHSELGYKQEQRFHLELGLLKLVHAQRLLPLEQILSEAQPAAGVARVSDPGARVGDPTSSPRGQQSGGPSPFERDRARKNAASPAGNSPPPPKAATGVGPAAAPGGTGGSAGLQAGETSAPDVQGFGSGTAVAVSAGGASPGVLKAEVIQALEGASSHTPVLEVTVDGAEVVIKVGVPQTLVNSGVALSEPAKRAAIEAASRLLDRRVRLRIVGTVNGAHSASPSTPPPANGLGARRRAADDPVVRRMQEKFGAQIRTVIDHREKR